MFDRDLEYAETVVRKKDARRNFAKFIGKHLCQCFFFNKVARLRPVRPWYRCFPVNFAKFLRTPFYIEHLWWLILCTPLDLLVFTHKPIKPILFYKIHRPESIGVVWKYIDFATAAIISPCNNRCSKPVKYGPSLSKVFRNGSKMDTLPLMDTVRFKQHYYLYSSVCNVDFQQVFTPLERFS